MTDILVPQTGSTFYGDKIISFRNMLSETDTEQAIRVGLNSIFGEIGLSEKKLSDTIDHCINSVKDHLDLLDYEHLIHSFLEQNGVLKRYHESKRNRASMRSEKVEKYLLGETVLDLGCGSGKIGAKISSKGYRVTLADVYKNPNILTLHLPFHQIVDGKPLPFNDNSFDNVLILSMLHHTQNPLHIIDECKRILKKMGRLHLIETVYGIPIEIRDGSYGVNDLSFRSLTRDQQRRVTMFFDYFANHVLDSYTEEPDKYVPVPFNFTTPDNLERIFQENGFGLISKEHLGIYPFSYVYHTHFVYSKEFDPS